MGFRLLQKWRDAYDWRIRSGFLSRRRGPASRWLLLVCRSSSAVVKPFADRRRHQVDGSAAPIWIVRDGVEGHGQVTDRRHIPGFLPPGHTLLQHLDDGFGDFLANRGAPGPDCLRAEGWP